MCTILEILVHLFGCYYTWTMIPVAISTLELVNLCIVLTKFLMYWNFKIDVRLVILLLGGRAKHFIVKVNPDDF